jgi:hypothetical protein
MSHICAAYEEKNYVVWLNHADYPFSNFLSGPVLGHDAAGRVADQNDHTDCNRYSRSALPTATPIVITHLLVSN